MGSDKLVRLSVPYSFEIGRIILGHSIDRTVPDVLMFSKSAFARRKRGFHENGVESRRA
jgi:hypothetical protein